MWLINGTMTQTSTNNQQPTLLMAGQLFLPLFASSQLLSVPADAVCGNCCCLCELYFSCCCLCQLHFSCCLWQLPAAGTTVDQLWMQRLQLSWSRLHDCCCQP